MPPQISDDEGSVSSGARTPVKPAKVQRKSKSREVEEEPLNVESDKEEEEEEDDEEDVGEDEYVVESILSHMFDAETGELKFEIKWEGFEKKSDRTWEPEENLLTAEKVLNAYLEKHGGKEQMIAEFQEMKNAGSKKRGRSSTGGAVNGAKRGKKSNGTASSTPPLGAVEFKPPTGNWEEEVVMIDACEGSEGSVVVFLTWKGGQKTQHPLVQVYKRCPQKMLKFYESHLVFKKNDEN